MFIMAECILCTFLGTGHVFEVLQNVVSFLEVLENMVSFLEVLENVVSFLEVLQNVVSFCEVLQNVVSFLEVLQNVVSFFEVFPPCFIVLIVVCAVLIQNTMTWILAIYSIAEWTVCKVPIP